MISEETKDSLLERNVHSEVPQESEENIQKYSESAIEEIHSLYNVKCKTELRLKRAVVELSYAEGLLDSYKLNLFVGEQRGGLDIINLLAGELGVGEKGIDIIDELKNKVNKQEDIRNKCYAAWSDLDDIYAKENTSYYTAVDLYNNERPEEDNDDHEYDCRFCGRNACECDEDHDDEMRDIRRENMRWCGCGCS